MLKTVFGVCLGYGLALTALLLDNSYKGFQSRNLSINYTENNSMCSSV